ncbi:uncharacterized protein B0H18DRAFT_980797 [Fomitopsis serialis]|uniref:uncharacterized protein n=1 Tax=Fomitopsis serialis TaxID=139415 RepID=UPI0020086F6C|nr:uncharacterized protein B0H18DRAFT_980797 [Neoantrodia serialis]KAH9934304.1 hypothetical protein B0H18DRAFT_980797 [Neoantrodia serialis]
MIGMPLPLPIPISPPPPRPSHQVHDVCRLRRGSSLTIQTKGVVRHRYIHAIPANAGPRAFALTHPVAPSHSRPHAPHGRRAATTSSGLTFLYPHRHVLRVRQAPRSRNPRARRLRRRDRTRARRLPPAGLHILELDVTEPEDTIKRKAAEAVAVWGRVDVLVNNAGNAPKSLLEEGGSTTALEQFNVNFFGQLNVTHAILPYMRDRRSGTVVFLGSRSVWKPDAVMTGYYIASKAAIHAYSETLAAEVARFNVKVLLVAPGHFRTEKLHTAPYVMAHHIPAYDAMREEEMARFNQLWHKARGDTDRAVEVIVDVVRGEGAHSERLAHDMDAWRDVAKDLDIQEEQEA